MILLKKYTIFFLILILLLVLSNFTNADNEDLRLIKEFAKTWDLKKQVTYSDDLLRPPKKGRDLISIKNNGYGCQQPGYTGQYCEFPICELTNIEHSDKESVSVLIDFIHLNTCNISKPLFIDVSMFTITIEIHSPGNLQPDLNIYDNNGTLITPFSTDTSDPSKSIFVYQPHDAGIYQMLPLSATPETGCFLYVSAVAQSHIDIGFIPSSQYDTIPSERNDYPNSNPYVNQLNTIVAHTINIKEFGGISTFSVFQEYNIISRPQLVNKRYGCIYGYYYNNFFCYKRDYYFLKIEGYDYFGNSFSRIKAFSCVENPNPPLPYPTTVPINPTSCQNNGTLVTNPDNTTYCYCNNLFTSYDCSKRLCFNNGTSLDDGTCLCREYYTGDHCQDIRCLPDTAYLPAQDHHKPIFVIRTRKQMNTYINELAAQIKSVAIDMGDLVNEWFKDFGLVMFNNNGSVFETNSFNSHEDFSNYLTFKAINDDQSGESSDIVFTSLITALQDFKPSSRSPIYVLTDAIPNDMSYFDNINEFNSYILSPIYFFVFQEQSQDSWDIYSPQWRAMEKLSERFSGNVFLINSIDSPNFGDIFYNHISYTYLKSELMYGNDADICTDLSNLNDLAIDSQFDKLVIIATGNNLNLHLSTPDGSDVTVTSKLDSTSIYIWMYNGLQNGQWEFSINTNDSSTSCSIRAYSILTSWSEDTVPYLKLNWGWSSSLVYDAPIRQPIAEMQSSLVVKIDNYDISNSEKINAEVVIYSKTDKGKVMSFASNGIYRDGCIFSIYFSPFTCHVPEETLYFTLFVKDSNNFNIQRAGSMYCSSSNPTIAPPSFCQNNGFKLNDTCICPPSFSGKNCELPVCQNGGTSTKQGCICPPLIRGQFCEILTCIEKPENPEFFGKNRSLIFLLDITYTNRAFLKQLYTYSDALIRDIMLQDNEPFEYVYIYGFDDNYMPIPIGITDIGNVQLINGYFGEAYDKSLKAKQSCIEINTWEVLNLARMMADPYAHVLLFQASPPHETLQTWQYLYTKVYDAFINKGLTLTTYIGALGKQKYYCNGTFYTFNLLQTLSEATYQGDYIETTYATFMNVIKVIPSYVNSGIVFKKNYNECGGNCSLYFSIDSHTQNVQVRVKGGVGGYKGIFITPNQVVDDSSYTLIDDPNTGVGIFETRKECDDGWESLGPQYCMMYVSEQFSWSGAHDYCMIYNAFLIDDMYPSKDSYLTGYQVDRNISNIWLGLTKLKAYSNQQWSWNHDPIKSVPLTETHYTNWDVNAILNDSTRECAYKTYNWNTDNCSNTRPFICQKHKYQDNFDPSLGEIEGLPPGKWQFIVTSNGETNIEVRVQSKIQIFGGFLSNVHGNTIDISANSYSDNQYMALHVSLINNNLFNTFMVNSRMFMENFVAFEAVNYQPREFCLYQFISQPFKCPDYNQGSSLNFYALSTGVDELGYTIQRYTTHQCVKQIKTCNNGFLYKGECICKDDWTGSLCQTPICQNNGTYNSDTNTCTCKIGYTGKTCDLPICFNPSSNQISEDNKMFVVVLENTQENLYAINSFRKNISSVFESVNSKWFNEYAYILFDSTETIIVKRFNNLSDFVHGLQTIVPQDTTTLCKLPIFKVLMVAFNQLNSPKSIVYTITRALPSDSAINGNGVMKALVETSPQLFYNILPGYDTCLVNMTDPLLQEIEFYALSTGGNIFKTTKYNVGEAFSVILPTLYHGSILSNLALHNTSCSKNIRTYINTDYTMTDIYIYVYGRGLLITLGTPDGYENSPTEVFRGDAIDMKQLVIYKFSLFGEYGMYILNVYGDYDCYCQVRTVGSSQLYYGFVPTVLKIPDIGKHLDNATSIPMNDYNQIVGSVAGDEIELKYVEVYSKYTDETRYLKFYKRDGCLYKYYSEYFQCTGGPILLKFYGQDIGGYTFVRESLTLCGQYNFPITPSPYTTPSGIIPTITSSELTTTPFIPNIHNSVANIYLINDVSSNVPAHPYTIDFVDFLSELFFSFQIDPNYINVALSASPGDNNIWYTLPTFNTFKSKSTLINSFVSSYSPLDGSQTPGQKQLKDVLKMALNPNFLSTGYDANHHPHIIMYLTTTSSPDDNAISQGQAIIKSGYFKIISVALKPENNIASLESMSSCFYQAKDPFGLIALAKNISNGIYVSSMLGIEYDC